MSSVFPFAFRPALRNAVPQIGPDVPPACEANTVPTLTRKVPMSARSIDGSSVSTARKPSQIDFPKSASPISPSKSQKYFSCLRAIRATVCRARSTSRRFKVFILGSSESLNDILLDSGDRNQYLSQTVDLPKR